MEKKIEDYYNLFKNFTIDELVNKEKELEVFDLENSDIRIELNILKEIIMVFNKIKELPFNEETTLATILNYDPTNKSVSPITQGTFFACIMEICKKSNIFLEVNDDELGGLGYYYKFKKIKNPFLSNELRINKELVADNKETKEVYDEFKKELDNYNNTFEGNLGDILDKFNNTFDIKNVSVDNNFEKTKNDIRNALDDKIKELESQLTEQKTEDGFISDFSIYKREKITDNFLITNPTNVKIVIQSGLGLNLLSFIKRNNEMQFAYFNNVAVITDLDEKFVPISNEKYDEFILKLNNIIKKWNKVYLGQLNNEFWMVSLYNDMHDNFRIIGSGSYPFNWNEYIDLISEYEILYKKLFNESKVNFDIDEKFEITKQEADELINIIDKKIEELNKKEDVENIIDNT